MKTLLIGGGYLGKRLAEHYRSRGPVDVITRSLTSRTYFKNRGCGHFARDITKNSFHHPVKGYDLAILNAAVTVDFRFRSAKQKLYVDGTANIFRLLKNDGFRGKLIIIGSTSAVKSLSLQNTADAAKKGKKQPLINESILRKQDEDYTDPAFQQYKLWEKQKVSCSFPAVLLLSARIYGPGRSPVKRLVQGLRSTVSNADQWLNLVHIDDLAGAVIFTEQKVHKPDFFFICDGHPVTLGRLYDFYTQKMGLPPVEFLPPQSGSQRILQGKRLDNSKILRKGFKLMHTSLMGDILR